MRPALLCILLLLGSVGQALAADRPVHIIFDTDITGDVDDVLALAMLHALADRNECIIDAVTISKINPLAAPFTDAVNTFYKRGDLPIGAARKAQVRQSEYLHLAEQKNEDGTLRYPHDVESSASVPDAVQMLRQTLAKAEDHSVVIVQVGLAKNLADLLDSQPDEFSKLTGPQLVAKKVRLASVMAGAFAPVNGNSRFLEANVRNDVRSMQRFADDWPDEVPVIWSDFRIGIATPYPRESIARDFEYRKHHIVREAYLAHSGPNHDRPSWDLTSVLVAVRPDDGYFKLSEPGRVSVADDGFTSFEKQENGRDRYLILDNAARARVIATQRLLVSQPPKSE